MGRLNENTASTGAVYAFHTIDQMLTECDRRNGLEWVIGCERWYFVAPPEPATLDRPAKLARIEYIEGPKALEMRARANGTYEAAWEPEPGEMEWIKRAVGEFIKRYPQQIGEGEAAYRDRFQRQMDRWHSAKPWLHRTEFPIAGEAA